jgi:hypothetical protein
MLDQRQPDFDDQIEQTYQQAQYLAKNYTKELNSRCSWRVTATRTPKR